MVMMVVVVEVEVDVASEVKVKFEVEVEVKAEAEVDKAEVTTNNVESMKVYIYGRTVHSARIVPTRTILVEWTVLP